LIMKKLLIAGMTIAGAIGVLAQGSVAFNNFVSGSPETPGVNVVFHIYSPQAVDTGTVTGNSSVPYSTSVRSGDYPTGTQTYTGTLIGGSAVGTGPTAWANGNNYSVDLVAAPGDNATGALTLVAGSVTTFRTTSASVAGWFVAPSGALSIPGTTYLTGAAANGLPNSATCAVQAWYSGGTAYPTYASAVAADVPHGQGADFNVDGLGGGNITAPNIANAQSFSLTTAPIPEPGMIALGVMGACAFLARRRMLKK
jgi:hypothetical protein